MSYFKNLIFVCEKGNGENKGLRRDENGERSPRKKLKQSRRVESDRDPAKILKEVQNRTVNIHIGKGVLSRTPFSVIAGYNGSFQCHAPATNGMLFP